MTFEPFGYRFDISSQMPPSDVKTAIRGRKKRWFDSRSGARGWIVGPFICLWRSAFDRNGPMLFGLISEDGFGTRIRGRAGSDLNGMAMFTIVLPLIGFFLYDIIADGSWSFGQVAVFGGLIIISPLVFWWSHRDRKEAEPLVRFLRDVAATSGGSRRSGGITIRQGLTLSVSGSEQEESVTPALIRDTLMDMGTADFVILQRAPEHYIQTALQDRGFVIERREDSDQNHFHAVRQSENAAGIFSFEEAEAALIAYASDTAMPTGLRWERMDMSDPSRW